MRVRGTKHRDRGFTIIELMVSLVVAGLLMASLVAVSGSVQKAFGHAKDIADLQTNLRFAMKTLVDDISRASFMVSPNPNMDAPCHYYTTDASAPPPDEPAIAFGQPKDAEGNPTGNDVLTLRGNFASSRDFLMNIQDVGKGKIVCRNQMEYGPPYYCGVGTAEDDSADRKEADKNTLPFGYSPEQQDKFNQEQFDRVFCVGRQFRLDNEDRHFQYHEIQSTTAANMEFTFSPALDRSVVKGFFKWINPISRVEYELVADPNYKELYGAGPDARKRWVLHRRESGCQEWADREVADFLLPPTNIASDADQPGMELGVVRDTAAPASGFCAPPWLPVIAAAAPVDGANPLNPLTARAVVLTLRGRTVAENPGFTLPGYADDPDNQNLGVDLDGKPDNGLAQVRTERTVIQLRNLGINQGT